MGRAVWWDYKKEASYFITFNVFDKDKALGKVINQKMKLNDLGQIVEDIIHEFNSQNSNVSVSNYCIMPDHIHLILNFKPANNSYSKKYNIPSEFIRALKAKASINIRKTKPDFKWQDNFYEIIIKNIYHLQNTIDYINNNAKNYTI